jgi:hypothetical protein
MQQHSNKMVREKIGWAKLIQIKMTMVSAHNFDFDVNANHVFSFYWLIS